MADNKKLHVVMFPWLAFGHMIPFLELSKLIAQKGHLVSFVSTPRNIDRLPELHPDLSSLINFVKLSMPPVDNLPEDAEATSDLPYNMVPYLKKAYDGLREGLTSFLASSDADWILYDFAPFWVSSVGLELGIKTVCFSIFTAPCLGFIGPPTGDNYRKSLEDYTEPPKWVNFPTKVAFRYFEILKISDSLETNESGVSDSERFKLALNRCDIVAVRGCSDFEPEWFELLDNFFSKPVFPVGQLPTTEYDSGEVTEEWRSIRNWLDEQENATVVYVAFGSEAKPSQDELTEIAMGLEQSKLPFFWVLRTRRGATDPEPIELPEGFEDRTRGRGVVWKNWAPQLKILSHDSVGGFLTHSGWSSVVEAVQFGKALILLTFLADQGINARVLEEKMMGYPIPRKEDDGLFSRDSVANSVRLVMVEEEGRIYRERIKEVKKFFVDGNKQDNYIHNFLGYLHAHRNPKNISRHIHTLALRCWHLSAH